MFTKSYISLRMCMQMSMCKAFLSYFLIDKLVKIINAIRKSKLCTLHVKLMRKQCAIPSLHMFLYVLIQVIISFLC